MAIKINDEVILQINKLYNEIGTYSGVAKIIGCAPTTVKKYIVKDFVEPKEVPKFKVTSFPFNFEIMRINSDWKDMCDLTEEEKLKMRDLWEEMSI